MDAWQKRRLRRITEAVYQSASSPQDASEPSTKHRFLPSASALAALVAVVVLIVGVSVVKWMVEPTQLEADVGTPTAQSGSDTSEIAILTPESGVSNTDQATLQSGDNLSDTAVTVYVSGCVNAPGVVTLPEGARVIDAVEAAGGACGEADLAAINLARHVTDGEQIDVTKPGEISHSAGAAADSGSGGNAGSHAGGTSCVDLNTADQVALEQLDGVGPALAKRIIDYRQQVGHIQSAEQLDDVSGIGPALVSRIAPGVCP